MSTTNIKETLDRISIAPPTSPIAVFSIPGNPGYFKSVFANTVVAQRQIRLGDENLVGCFNQTQSQDFVKRVLIEATK